MNSKRRGKGQTVKSENVPVSLKVMWRSTKLRLTNERRKSLLQLQGQKDPRRQGDPDVPVEASADLPVNTPSPYSDKCLTWTPSVTSRRRSQQQTGPRLFHSRRQSQEAPRLHSSPRETKQPGRLTEDASKSCLDANGSSPMTPIAARKAATQRTRKSSRMRSLRCNLNCMPLRRRFPCVRARAKFRPRSISHHRRPQPRF